MKVYLDEKRKNFPGWIQAITYEQIKDLISCGCEISIISLGPNFQYSRDTFDFYLWLEDRCSRKRVKIPVLKTHINILLG